MTHLSLPISRPGEFDPGREVHNALEAEPDGFHAGLSVAFAPEKALEASDQAQHLVEVRSFFGRGFLAKM